MVPDQYTVFQRCRGNELKTEPRVGRPLCVDRGHPDTRGLLVLGLEKSQDQEDIDHFLEQITLKSYL